MNPIWGVIFQGSLQCAEYNFDCQVINLIVFFKLILLGDIGLKFYRHVYNSTCEVYVASS